jgi:cytochrome P450
LGKDTPYQVFCYVRLQADFRATANALAVAFWAVFHVLSSSQLVSRVRDCSEAGQIQESQTLDGTKLIRDPLMQSIFAEATRICVNGLLPMTAEKDIDVGRWSIPRGSIILISSIIGATNPDVWNAGSQEEPHPLDRFWADRFVIYPDDPNSGPLRNPRKPSATREQQNEHASSNSITEIKEPTFSVKGLSGSYLPFGDGSIKCPGRDFARAEVICTLAQLLLNYDMELRVPEGWEPKMDTNWFPLGALPPVDKVPFRIRRRL